MFYNTTFPTCYVLHKLKIRRQHVLIYVKFSPLFAGYTYVWVAALESHENQCQTQPLSPRGPTAAPTPILMAAARGKWRQWEDPIDLESIQQKKIYIDIAVNNF